MLDNFFAPKAVAVIGASRVPGKVGFDLFRNLVQYNFRGRIYPVNPKAGELFGLKCYPAIKDIPDRFNLAVLMIPPKLIPDALRDCCERGADSAIIISAGFKETGIEGAAIEREMLKTAGECGMRLLGPNCLGIIDTHSRLNASFAAGMPAQGSIGFMSQSGALCTAILDWSYGSGVGFSKFISVGNKADLDEVDILEMLGSDDATKVIIGYIEGTNRGRALLKTGLRVTKNKPVILIKSGSSEAGARAASSHTGSMAGSDAAFDTAFRQAGIIRARTVEELFDYAVAFSTQPLPNGNRIAILTNAGGPGIMATDALQGTNARMASFAAETINMLKEKLPPTAALYNPVDIIGDARADRYENAIAGLLTDPGVDGLIILLTPQGMTQIEETAKSIVYSTIEKTKPVLTAFMGEDMVESGIHILKKNSIPNYSFPERAVAVFSRMADYVAWRATETVEPVKAEYNKENVGRIIADFKKMRKTSIAGESALRIFNALGIRVPVYRIANDIEEAKETAAELTYPVVMKVSSPDISHKSDVGGVVAGICDEDALVRAYNQILVNCRRFVPQAVIQGVEIHQMVTGGKEVIVGMIRDSQFGPMVMFGLGGIYVEVLKDVNFRVAPLRESDIDCLINEMRSIKLLTGARGEKRKDLNAVKQTLRLISTLVMDFEEIIEMDINPLMVLEEGQGVYAIDARFSIKVD
ncbi:MAG: acetate--CoA ligase alpha subunit [bacterium]